MQDCASSSVEQDCTKSSGRGGATERKEEKNYVGRVTLPTSIKEKEARWLIKSREPPPPRDKKERQN
eukprot:680124-Pelagomonas_calceolata.AAC.1